MDSHNGVCQKGERVKRPISGKINTDIGATHYDHPRAIVKQVFIYSFKNIPRPVLMIRRKESAGVFYVADTAVDLILKIPVGIDQSGRRKKLSKILVIDPAFPAALCNHHTEIILSRIPGRSDHQLDEVDKRQADSNFNLMYYMIRGIAAEGQDRSSSIPQNSPDTDVIRHKAGTPTFQIHASGRCLGSLIDDHFRMVLITYGAGKGDSFLDQLAKLVCGRNTISAYDANYGLGIDCIWFIRGHRYSIS